jgi:hypothetical protein
MLIAHRIELDPNNVQATYLVRPEQSPTSCWG